MTKQHRDCKQSDSCCNPLTCRRGNVGHLIVCSSCFCSCCLWLYLCCFYFSFLFCFFLFAILCLHVFMFVLMHAYMWCTYAQLQEHTLMHTFKNLASHCIAMSSLILFFIRLFIHIACCLFLDWIFCACGGDRLVATITVCKHFNS